MTHAQKWYTLNWRKYKRRTETWPAVLWQSKIKSFMWTVKRVPYVAVRNREVKFPRLRILRHSLHLLLVTTDRTLKWMNALKRACRRLETSLQCSVCHIQVASQRAINTAIWMKSRCRVEKMSNWEGKWTPDLSMKYPVNELYRLFSKLQISIIKHRTHNYQIKFTDS